MAFTRPEVHRGETNCPVFDEDSGYDTATTLGDGDVVMRDAPELDLGTTDWAIGQLSAIHNATPIPNGSSISSLQDGGSSGSSDSSEYEDFLARLSCRRWPLGMCTMPTRLTSKGGGPTKLHPRPSLKSLDSSSSMKQSSNSLRSPDRFIASVDTLDSAVQKFRINKDANKLSPHERLLRNDSVSPDAFSARRSFTTPAPPAIGHRRNSTSARPGDASTLTFRRDSNVSTGERQVSLGSVWTVGGIAPVSVGVSNGRGGLTGSGTNAPLYTTSFSSAVPKVEEEREKHEGRLAKALEVDRTTRIRDYTDQSFPRAALLHSKRHSTTDVKTEWKGTEWALEGGQVKQKKPTETRTLPTAPFKVLDAPNLRDDFYCSVLAYSHTSHTLAVGLGSLLYAWSEMQGVHLLNSGNNDGTWLTSIAFSSTQGCKCILAYGRSNGTLNLMSLYDRAMPRFEVQQPCPIACITWRPTVTMRPSRSPHNNGQLVKTEDLIVGDEVGNVYYYAVEWPDAWEVDRNGWTGVMTLIARISIHTQQICGLAWSQDGNLLATGGNDNLCCLFQASKLLRQPIGPEQGHNEVITGLDGIQRAVPVQMPAGQINGEAVTALDGIPRVVSVPASAGQVSVILPGAEKHRWVHGAAVKAIAFCPWRDGLVATGGGSNDKCIHFFHAVSGACLATISVAAQVTSLIWSTTRREICATFGYAQPEHPYRIAVFSWPECKQVAAIPWEGEHRALYAIPYPGGPNDSHNSAEGGSSMSRTAQEGCIVVAASDESVKFHEVWSAGQKATAGGEGLLGGSDILEGLEGIDKEGDIIR